ncbi:MAG: hypothetical protein ACYCPF_02975 [Streptosporangiaceae bacterium]
MAPQLIVMTRGSQGTWAVYRNNGTLARSVSTWAELDALVAEENVASNDVVGAGLAEMIAELGPKPEITGLGD